MEAQEMKQRIKDYFVEIKEDKFTKVKTIKCKHNIIWKGKELENKFMLTKNSYSNELKMGIDYRHKDEVDSVFFTFIYTNSDGGYPGMTNIKMYLILDDDKNIELSEGSGFDHTSQSSKIGDNYISVYLETAQLAVGMADFIAIANAKKIEYSIRFGQGSIENSINQNDLILFKGFYNAAFDDEFESNLIFDAIKDSKTFSFSSNQNDEIIKLLKEGKKLAAVKLHKELTGMGLKESKDYVEQLAKDLNIVGVVASNGKGGCFVATAAMGNYDHPVVVELRFFRDNWLLKRKWGLLFTNWYYANGPKAAVIIEKSIILRKLTFILVVKPLQLFSKILN